MSIKISIHQNLLQLTSQWDSVLPFHHHLISKHLIALQNSNIKDVEHYFVLVTKEAKTIGIAYFQVFNFHQEHVSFTKNGFKTKLIKFLLRKKMPLLICGNLFRIEFQGFYFIDKKNDALIFDVIDLFKKQTKVKPCGVMIKDCDERFNQIASIKKYTYFDGDKTMILENRNTWSSFDEYINNLKKDYFKRAKKVLQAFESIESVEFGVDEIKANAIEIERLYWNVIDKQRVKLGTINAEYFVELKKDLQEKFELHALYYQQKMIGFYTFIFYEKSLETHYIGLDYEANNTFKLYFNILFKSVTKMIERKANYLELGRTAREAKANIGAKPKQIYNYIRVSNFIARKAVEIFLKKFNEKESLAVVDRNPFRN